jgi:SRSO17 transposase
MAKRYFSLLSRKTGVPKEIRFKTKPQIALEQLRWACAAGIPRGVVLMDAGYGADTDLRATIRLSYVVGIMPNTSVWAPGEAPLGVSAWSNGDMASIVAATRASSE